MKKRMNQRLARVAVMLLTMTGALVTSAAQAADTIPGAPTGVLLSATACAASEVVNDADAMGGKAVTSGGDYSSLIDAKLPETGEAFTSWAHRKGGPIQLKAVVNGAQKEKKWDCDGWFFIHPCRVAGLNKLFQHFFQNPVGWL